MIAKHSAGATFTSWGRPRTYHPFLFCFPLSSSTPLFPPAEWLYQPCSLISIALLWNTGPVVDMLASYPTGPDKLLASLSERSEDSQPGAQNVTTGPETICPDRPRSNAGRTRSCRGIAGAGGKEVRIEPAAVVQHLSSTSLRRACVCYRWLNTCFAEVFLTSPWRVEKRIHPPPFQQ